VQWITYCEIMEKMFFLKVLFSGEIGGNIKLFADLPI
jgi:hypothetical protein